MGYRSSVAAVFYVNKEENFPVLKLWLDENFPMQDWEDNVRWFRRGMVIEADYLKWYESYSDVKRYKDAEAAFIELCNNELRLENTPTFLYEFVRIGEDYDDVDVVREGICPEFLLEINRSVHVEV